MKSLWDPVYDAGMRAGYGVRAVVPALLALLSLTRLLAAASATRPNVLVVLTEDRGLGHFSGGGNPVLKTPALDRLREEAMRFSDFHSAPMSTPTRGQLMTEKDAARNGATSVTGGRSFIRPGIPTMPETLAVAGNDLCGAYYADIAYIPSTAGGRPGAAGGTGALNRGRETAR